LVSAVWAVRTRACTTPAWISRAKLWASGRKSRVDDPSWNRLSRPGSALLMSEAMLRWVSMQPLGRPVVPLV
jgi:hypothetical protein